MLGLGVALPAALSIKRSNRSYSRRQSFEISLRLVHTLIMCLKVPPARRPPSLTLIFCHMPLRHMLSMLLLRMCSPALCETSKYRLYH